MPSCDSGPSGTSWRVVLARPLTATAEAILRDGGCEVVGPVADHSDLLRELSAADAVIVRSTPRVDAVLLDAAPRLRVVGRAGVGLDHIDRTVCAARGVEVVNTPDANTVAAAELTIALLLSLARNLTLADRDLAAGRWRRGARLGFELAGRTLGIVGLGRIGGAVARRAAAFDMRLLVADPYITEERVRQHGAERLALDDLLPRVDAVTLHTPLNDETLGLLDARRLALLAEGAVVLNCARGGLVDEQIVLERVEAGQLAGAGFDVFSEEPADPWDLEADQDAIWRRLAAHPRIVCTPHLGSQTTAAQERMACDAARAVLAALDADGRESTAD